MRAGIVADLVGSPGSSCVCEMFDVSSRVDSAAHICLLLVGLLIADGYVVEGPRGGLYIPPQASKTGVQTLRNQVMRR
jgi:hypothetical protein